jgi:putative transposase
MSTYTQICYHIVFSTKNREPVLEEDRRTDLFRYVWGILRNKRCHLYRINGVDDHLHLFNSLHPSICLADLVKDIKLASSDWIKENGVFRRFSHWQEGYGAFTLAYRDKDALIEYIKGQPEHHRRVTYIDEFRRLLEEAGIEYDEKYLL